MFTNKAGTLHKHAARAGSGIKNTTMKRFDDTDNKLNNGGWSKELSTLLPLAHGKVPKEVFINLAKSIPLDIHWHRVHGFEQLFEQGVLETVVALGQNILEIRVLRLYCPHGLVDCRTNIDPFRQLYQCRKASLRWQKQHTLGLVVRRAYAAPPATRPLKLFGCYLELVVGKSQKDQPKHRNRVFRRFQL